MHKAQVCTARKDVNDDNEDINAWAKLLNRKGNEVGADGINQKVEQAKAAKVSGGNLQVDNIVLSHIEINSRISEEVVCTTEQMVARDISALMMASLMNAQHCAYENSHRKVCLVVYTIFEEIVFRLVRLEMMHKILKKLITNCSDISDVSDKF